MAALEERAWKFELGVDHIRGAFKRANDGFMNACKMLEAEQRRNQKLEAENAQMRELVYDMLEDEERGHNDDRTFYEHVERARDFGIEVDA